jgi:ankyrin repeat protein
MRASASQASPKRNSFVAWFERRRARKERVSAAYPLRRDHEEYPSSDVVAKQAGEGNMRIAGREEAPEEASASRPRRLGNDYRYITAQDSARMQIGDTYIEQQNVISDPAALNLKSKKTMRGDFMADLAFGTMVSRLATIGTAHAETCAWLFDKEGYRRWRDPGFYATHNGILWIKGKPGAGKSTLMKHALSHMRHHNHDDSAIISFFFNARGYDLEKSSEGMYRSLLYQILDVFRQRLPGRLDLPTSTWRTQGWPIQVLQDLLRQTCLDFGNGRKLVCYIDALDECSEDAIRSALEYFEELGESAHSRGISLSFCLASRHYPNITMKKRHETINLDVEGEHQRDISAFVTRKLRGEHGLRSDLSQQISRRSLGVFLWAALVVQMMNKMIDRGATRSQLLSELKLVPDGIEELLRTIILDGDLALLSTLQWLLFSKEKLEVEELYFAIKTGVGYLSSARNDAAETSDEQMRLFILTSSKGLVEFTCDRCPTAQLIHETVREYLLSGGLSLLDASLANNMEAMSHARLGQWCHDYIKAPTSCRTKWSVFWGYCTKYMLVHMDSSLSGGALDLRFIDTISQETWLTFRRRVVPGSRLNSLSASPVVTSLFVLITCQFTQLAEAILQRQLAYYSRTGNQTPTTDASIAESSTIPSVDVNAVCEESIYGTALLAAIFENKRRANDRVVKLLLKCGACPNLAAYSGWTPFREALAYQLGDHVQLFSESDAYPDLWVPMQGVVAYHPEDHLARLLLQYGANPNTVTSHDPDESVLGLAVKLAKKDVVDLLLSFGANVRGYGTERLLCSAAAYNSLSMVQVLLAAGANVDDHNQSGRTALQEAVIGDGARNVQISIAQALLDAGADVDAMDNDCHTASTMAFCLKRYGLAKLLLDRGADPNMSQHREIVRKLQDYGHDYTADGPVDPDVSATSLMANVPESPAASGKYCMTCNSVDSDASSTGLLAQYRSCRMREAIGSCLNIKLYRSTPHVSTSRLPSIINPPLGGSGSTQPVAAFSKCG